MAIGAILGAAGGAVIGVLVSLVAMGTSWAVVALILTAGGMIGFVGGMLFMRDSYLGLLLEERLETRMMLREADRRADVQRRIGYAVGLRLGSGK